MRYLVLALLVPVLTGCMGLDQKFADARVEWGESVADQARDQKEANALLLSKIEASKAELAVGLKTAEEHLETVEEASEARDITIGESLDQLGVSVAGTWDDLKEGVEAEVDAVKASVASAAGGVTGFGMAGDLISAALAAVLAANAARNRNLPGTHRLPPKGNNG